MGEKKYLYGAAVQGIQSFIFQTNALKDIAGASELVAQICTNAFDEYGKDGINGISVIKAAGNIKFIFENKTDCQKAVLEFPRKVMEMAPGITISQAVVSYCSNVIDGEDIGFKKAVNELEKRLHIQRNRPIRSMTIGQIGMLRSRKTGMPVVEIASDIQKGKEYFDLATQKKRQYESTQSLCLKSFGEQYIDPKNIARQIDKMTLDNNWIAIVHADGNGLGQIIPRIGTNPSVLKDFSRKLDIATTEAANSAYKVIYEAHPFGDKVIPIRPIVLNGDDMTIICRGSIALDYAEAFMKAFEEKTREHLGDIISSHQIFNCSSTHLTACAGIAYIKSSYPFHYGYHLAETLCRKAKQEAKLIVKQEGCQNLPPSSLMFHKVQSSFIEDYDEIIKKELTASTGTSFNFGPYYLEKQKDNAQGHWSNRWSIEELKESIKYMNDESTGNPIKSHLREWLNLIINNPGQAQQELERLLQMLNLKTFKQKNEEQKKWVDWVSEITNLDIENRTPVYDILSICSINYLETKQ